MARILFIDDDPEQLTIQRKLLEVMGCEVSTASAPAEALAELAAHPPEVIVMDLRIPNAADGLGLIRAIRQSGCTLPLILLSGWPDDLYGAPEEQMVTRVMVKGNARELMDAIRQLAAC